MALSKEKSKLLERLRHPRFRAREGSFMVEGVRGVREFLRGTLPQDIRFVLYSPRLMASPPGGELLEALKTSDFPLEEVSDSELEASSETATSQGVLMVVREADEPLAVLSQEAMPRVLLLDGVQDPGNVGTLIRAAWAFGLSGVFALEGTVDPFNPKVVRASAGALGHIPVIRSSWAHVSVWLRERGVSLLVADSGGGDPRGTAPPPSWALAVGNEGAGPREELMREADRVLGIAMNPAVDSLNAGLAGAILMFALDSSSSSPDSEN